MKLKRKVMHSDYPAHWVLLAAALVTALLRSARTPPSVKQVSPMIPLLSQFQALGAMVRTASASEVGLAET